MDGPAILARTLSIATISDRYNNTWQYQSRSDHHSKVSCWGLLFDLLQHCPQLLRNVTAGKVGFGINHTMFDFRTNRKKDLDLVICTSSEDLGSEKLSFADLADRYRIRLTAHEASKLAEMPRVLQVPVGSVQVAMEAKAAMTEHIKARPRLYDELNSTHLAIHGAADFAIASGLIVINVAETFISPGRNKFDLSASKPIMNIHKQPKAANRVIEKLLEIPRRTQQGTEQGFDALGIIVIKLANDGSLVEIIDEPPARPPADPFSYNQMVYRISSAYSVKFANI